MIQLSPLQQQFVDSRAPTLILQGSAGGGKTVALAAAVIPRHPDARALLVRRDRTSVLFDLLESCTKVYAEHGARWHRSTFEFVFPNGGRVTLLSCPDACHTAFMLRGWHFHQIGVDVVNEFDDATIEELARHLATPHWEARPGQMRYVRHVEVNAPPGPILLAHEVLWAAVPERFG